MNAQVFISHAAKDESLVEDLADLLHVGIGVQPDDIFCSSLPGMSIPTGEAFVQYIKSQIAHPKLVLLIVSEEFLKSAFCQNEVGASWGLDLPMWPLLVPPVVYSDVRGVLADAQLKKIEDKESLNDLRDDLIKILKLQPYRTSHWERKRDRFLAKLPESTIGKSPSVAPDEPSEAVVVASSGSSLLLADCVLEAVKFQRHGENKLDVIVACGNGEEEAALERLRSTQSGLHAEPIPYAFQNDGGLARINEIKSTFEDGKQRWEISLVCQPPEGGVLKDVSHNFGGRHYAPDDIAELQAGRLLIDDPPPPKRRSVATEESFLESLISGGHDGKVHTGECIVRRIIGETDNAKTALVRARLEAVFRVKATGIVENVIELVLGPIAKDSVHVRFKGLRRPRYHGEQPETIQIVGECRLPQ